MNEITIFGRSYELPAIKDGRFRELQDAIQEGRDRIGRSEKPKGLASLFGRREELGPEERLARMEELTANYDELITVLREKIDACREVFGRIGEGVQDEFASRLAELEATEKRRADLAARIAASGRSEASEGMDESAEAIRAMVKDLSRATILIVRKLRHALDALETLAADDESQRRVYEQLKKDVGLYREVYEFQRDLRRLESEIAQITQVALSFDAILRDNLGPLSVLIDEIAKVDGRLGESLAEIERLSAELDKGRSASLGKEILSERFMDSLIAGRMRADVVSGIVGVLADPLADRLDADFEVRLAEAAAGAALDFSALAENMKELVRRGLDSMAALTPARAAADVPEPAAAAAPATAAAPAPAPEPDPTPAPIIDPSPAAPSPEPAPETAAAPASAPAPEPEAAPAPETEEPWTPPPPRNEAAFLWGRTRAPYAAAISRASPSLVLFLLDRSGSMDSPYADGLSRASYLARVVDSAIEALAVRCNKADGLRDYFHLAALGYGNGRVENAFGPALAGADWLTISEVATKPSSVEKNAAGHPRPRWIEAKAAGDTPMREAMEEACRLAAAWCDAHPDSYPPTVINVTDGEPSGGSPEDAAAVLRRIHTADGETLLFNLHVSGRGGGEIVFPDREAGLDEYGSLLFRMSSLFPPHLRDGAAAAGFSPGAAARFFAYGAGADLAVRFLNLGTRPGKLA